MHVPSGKNLICRRFIFQHESEHTVSAEYLDRNTHSGTLSVMDWPPNCFDLNIIEAIMLQLFLKSHERNQHILINKSNKANIDSKAC